MKLTRDQVHRSYNLDDETLAALPEIARHDRPQPSPQEYECGCVAIARVTDRDSRDRDSKPFEMVLAIPCDRPVELCSLPCPVPVIRHRGLADAGYEPCGNSLPCVHHGLTSMAFYTAHRMDYARRR